MKFDRILDAISDAAINAGAFVRCCGYAAVMFCIVAPLVIFAVQ